MASLTKDAVETGNSAPETTVSQTTSASHSQGKPAGGAARSEPVSLEVPVKVHGSRVTDVVRGVTPHTEPFEEQTSTMIVFPQGGVLRMNTSVAVGQMLVLTNLKSKQDAICRVLKVRSFPSMQSYVEVEFTQPQKGYWGVYFPAEAAVSAAPAPKPAPIVAPPAVAPPAESKKIISDISRAPASSSPATSSHLQKSAEPDSHAQENKPPIPVLPPPPPVPAKPASIFASLGTKEDVQIAADSTREVKPDHAASTVIEKEIRAAQPSKPPAAAEELPAPPKTALSIEELRGDQDEISTVLASLDNDHDSEHDRERKSAPEAKPVKATKSAAHESSAGATFGARLDLGVSSVAAQPVEGGQNWIMIAACIAVLFLAVGGGIWYFGQKPSTGQTAQPSAVSQPLRSPRESAPTATQPEITQPAESQPVQSAPLSTPITQTRTSAAPSSSLSPNSSSPRTSKPAPAAAAPSQTSVPQQFASQPAEQQPQQSPAPNTLGSSSNNAHPLSSQRVVAQNAAPSLDPAANSNAQGVLTGLGSNSLAAPPPPAPEAPVQVGGKVQAPRLISSVMPVYPSMAKQAHIEGDVVIDTQIDRKGNVIQMKAVSGPPALRQAALDAVRRWKYQPSTLDGQPVAIEMMVTVKFHL